MTNVDFFNIDDKCSIPNCSIIILVIFCVILILLIMCCVFLWYKRKIRKKQQINIKSKLASVRQKSSNSIKSNSKKKSNLFQNQQRLLTIQRGCDLTDKFC